MRKMNTPPIIRLMNAKNNQFYEWRIGQMMENIRTAYMNKYGMDIFYVTDEELMRFIENEM